MTFRALLLFVLILMAACQPPTSPSNSSRPDWANPQNDIRFEVPAFSFTERSGRTVTNPDLKGKVWVASFVFTRCTGPCPQVTANVARLQDALKDQPDVRFVTFTVDPERDKLTDLKKYAEQYRADADRWLFLTGKEKEIHEFATQGFKLLAMKRDNPKPGDEFDHSSKLAVVDKQGFIRGYFDGMAPDRVGGKDELELSLMKLKDLVAKLLKE